MKLSAAELESLVALLTRLYGDIYAIEEEFQLLVGDNDVRPRIEYFHDAVRAFTSGDTGSNRLSVELLSYDLSCLRYIHSMPLSSFRPHGAVLSAGTGMVKKDGGLMVKRRRPDRTVREQIIEKYQHYAMLFAALLKPTADRDYHERTDNLNQDVKDLHDLIQQLGKQAQGVDNLKKIAASVQHLEEDDLREQLQNFLQEQKHTKKDNLKKLAAFLKAHAAKKDKEIAAIDQAHMNYALSQLGIFEESKDMLKKMAAQGMNLVGKFVESSIAQSRRDMGR